MNILTDEEMKQIHADTFGKGVQSFARVIESAVLSKLAEQDVEPVAYLVKSMSSGVTDYVSATIINDFLRMNTDWKLAGKLYTEPQLLAAQQRTAEACAKVCNSRASETQEDEADKCADLIRNGEWREYL